jgi:hypothetical protein
MDTFAGRGSCNPQGIQDRVLHQAAALRWWLIDAPQATDDTLEGLGRKQGVVDMDLPDPA